jgi:hypothetical protein
MGREEVQREENLGAWYTLVAAYTHWFMDHPQRQQALLAYLQSVYRGEPRFDTVAPLADGDSWSQQLQQFLQVASGNFSPLRPGTQLATLCLGNTGCTADFIRSLPPQRELKWLDLAGIPLGSDDLLQFAGESTVLERLNLERTTVDLAIAPWLSKQKRLEELDISFTAIDDRAFESLERLPKLQLLWATGSQLSDLSVPRILAMRSLEQLDVQRTKISAAQLERIRAAFPKLQLNPLQLVSPQAP